MIVLQLNSHSCCNKNRVLGWKGHLTGILLHLCSISALLALAHSPNVSVSLMPLLLSLALFPSLGNNAASHTLRSFGRASRRCRLLFLGVVADLTSHVILQRSLLSVCLLFYLMKLLHVWAAACFNWPGSLTLLVHKLSPWLSSFTYPDGTDPEGEWEWAEVCYGWKERVSAFHFSPGLPTALTW